MLYMVIDTTELAAIKVAAVAKMKEAIAIGRIMQANGRAVIGPPLEGRGLAKMDLQTLQYLFWNTTATPPSDDYETLTKDTLAAIKKLPVDETELSVLEKEVARLYPEESGVNPSASTSATKEKKVREPRAEGAPPERPKGTSTTGRVWEIADAEFAKTGLAFAPADYDWKPLRTLVVVACKAAGINEATAATQYSKWKASKIVAQ